MIFIKSIRKIKVTIISGLLKYREKSALVCLLLGLKCLGWNLVIQECILNNRWKYSHSEFRNWEAQLFGKSQC